MRGRQQAGLAPGENTSSPHCYSTASISDSRASKDIDTDGNDEADETHTTFGNGAAGRFATRADTRVRVHGPLPPLASRTSDR